MKRGPFLSITRLTLVEIPRQPALLLLSSTLLLLMASLPFLITHSLGETGKLQRDSNLALLFLGSLLLAVPAACGALGSELRKGRIGALLSKPLSRSSFLMAKFLGVAGVLLAFQIMAIQVTIMSDRASAIEFGVGWKFIVPIFVAALLAYVVAALLNFATRRPFVSSAFWLLLLFMSCAFIYTLFLEGGGDGMIDHGGHSHVDPAGVQAIPVRWDLLIAGILLSLAALMLQALALLCALKLPTLPALSLCSGFFLLGLMSDYLLAERAEQMLWAKVLHGILPNWQHFWMADALTGGGSIPLSYLLPATFYALCWAGGILLLAMAFFERMELQA